MKKTTLHLSEEIVFEYRIINQSDHPQTAGSSMIYPAARFYIVKGDSMIGDSFHGVYFPTMPILVTLQPGDTLKTSWQAMKRVGQLPVGIYTGQSQLMYLFPDLQGVPNEYIDFSVTQ